MGARLGGQGSRGPDYDGVISKHPLDTVWHGTTLTSYQSGIFHSLIFCINCWVNFTKSLN